MTGSGSGDDTGGGRTLSSGKGHASDKGVRRQLQEARSCLGDVGFDSHVSAIDAIEYGSRGATWLLPDSRTQLDSIDCNSVETDNACRNDWRCWLFCPWGGRTALLQPNPAPGIPSCGSVWRWPRSFYLSPSVIVEAGPCWRYVARMLSSKKRGGFSFDNVLRNNHLEAQYVLSQMGVDHGVPLVWRRRVRLDALRLVFGRCCWVIDCFLPAGRVGGL